MRSVRFVESLNNYLLFFFEFMPKNDLSQGFVFNQRLFPKKVPWYNWGEWNDTYLKLYSKDSSERWEGVKSVRVESLVTCRLQHGLHEVQYLYK